VRAWSLALLALLAAGCLEAAETVVKVTNRTDAEQTLHLTIERIDEPAVLFDEAATLTPKSEQVLYRLLEDYGQFRLAARLANGYVAETSLERSQGFAAALVELNLEADRAQWIEL
jgi:hypothetical protein